jgi:hypothetical protein
MDQHSSYVALSRHRESVSLHYGKDDFADAGKLARTLSRERSKDMASDYGREELERKFAERRGITFRERIAEIVRKVPEKVRGRFDGLRLSQAPAPEADRQVRARVAIRRHAQAVQTIFLAQQDGTTMSQLREQSRYEPMYEEVVAARKELDAFGANYSRDIERAYTTDHSLVHEAADGKFGRAIRAMKAEQELRETTHERANQFVARWQKLKERAQQSYEYGDMTSHHSARSKMASMAEGLHRDPQLESLLANRKRELGIGIANGRSLGQELAFSHGLDLGRGRGLGL